MKSPLQRLTVIVVLTLLSCSHAQFNYGDSLEQELIKPQIHNPQLDSFEVKEELWMDDRVNKAIVSCFEDPVVADRQRATTKTLVLRTIEDYGVAMPPEEDLELAFSMIDKDEIEIMAKNVDREVNEIYELSVQKALRSAQRHGIDEAQMADIQIALKDRKSTLSDDVVKQIAKSYVDNYLEIKENLGWFGSDLIKNVGSGISNAANNLKKGVTSVANGVRQVGNAVNHGVQNFVKQHKGAINMVKKGLSVAGDIAWKAAKATLPIDEFMTCVKPGVSLANRAVGCLSTAASVATIVGTGGAGAIATGMAKKFVISAVGQTVAKVCKACEPFVGVLSGGGGIKGIVDRTKGMVLAKGKEYLVNKACSFDKSGVCGQVLNSVKMPKSFSGFASKQLSKISTKIPSKYKNAFSPSSLQRYKNTAINKLPRGVQRAIAPGAASRFASRVQSRVTNAIPAKYRNQYSQFKNRATQFTKKYLPPARRQQIGQMTNTALKYAKMYSKMQGNSSPRSLPQRDSRGRFVKARPTQQRDSRGRFVKARPTQQRDSRGRFVKARPTQQRDNRGRFAKSRSPRQGGRNSRSQGRGRNSSQRGGKQSRRGSRNRSNLGRFANGAQNAADAIGSFAGNENGQASDMSGPQDGSQFNDPSNQGGPGPFSQGASQYDGPSYQGGSRPSFQGASQYDGPSYQGGSRPSFQGASQYDGPSYQGGSRPSFQGASQYDGPSYQGESGPSYQGASLSNDGTQSPRDIPLSRSATSNFRSGSSYIDGSFSDAVDFFSLYAGTKSLCRNSRSRNCPMRVAKFVISVLFHPEEAIDASRQYIVKKACADDRTGSCQKIAYSMLSNIDTD